MFANQIRPDVPNQLGSSTPQNNMGLGMPWGQAMFNLPRFQMPGSSINFGGGFGLNGDMNREGPNQMGMAPGGGQANIGNVRFSLTRQASSDPVQNIINDIQNPLGGMNLNFSGGGAPQQQAPAPKPEGLKYSMIGQDNPYAAAMDDQNRFGPYGNQSGNMTPGSSFFGQGMSSFSQDGPGPYGSIATGIFQPSKFALKDRMLSPPLLPSTFM